MNGLRRALKIRVSIALFALIAVTASSGASLASASVSASQQRPAPVEHIGAAETDDDGPHTRMLFFVLLSAVGYAMYRQQRALESLHTLESAP
jgi:hypothetical protein